MPKLIQLTDRDTRKLKLPGRYCIDSSVSLYLEIPRVGQKKFLARTIRDGKRSWATVGPADLMTLAEARSEAVRVADTSKARSAETTRVKFFRDAAQDYIDRKSPGWKGGLSSKHNAQWRNTLETYAYPVIGNMRCDQILPEHLLQILEPIWLEKHETASRVRQRVSAVVRAELRRTRTHLPDPANLEDLVDILPRSRVQVRHHIAPTIAELRDLLASISKSTSATARALRFLIFTVARSGEVRGATNAEISGDIWTVPADRMKAGKEWAVPLTQGAIEAIGPSGNGFLFKSPGSDDKPLSDMALTQLLRKRGLLFVPHGVRGAFKSWATEQAFPHAAVELCLAHTPSKLEQAYQRSTLLEQRRVILSAWCNILTS